jgi:hypothetical protein
MNDARFREEKRLEDTKEAFYADVTLAVESDREFEAAVKAIREARKTIIQVAEAKARRAASDRHGENLDAMAEELGYSFHGMLSVAVDNALSTAMRKSG